MMEPLTDGAIVKMNAGATSKELQPVLQIFDLKMVSTPQSAVDRYRVILSDGTHLQQAMLATQKNYLVSEGRVKKGTIVRMTEYSVNTIQHRLIIIVCDMIVMMDIGDIIGDPKPFSSSGAPASAPTTPNMSAGSLQNPRMDSVNNSSYGSNADTGRYPSANRSGSYDNQSPGVQNFGVDVPRVGDIIGYPKPFRSTASAPTTLNMAAGSLQNSRIDSVNNSSYGSNADTGRYPSANRSGSYDNQSPGVQNFGVDVPRVGDINGDPKPFSSTASAPTTPNMAAGSLQNSRIDSVNNSSYGSNADTGRYPSANRSGSYGNQSPGVQNFGVDVPRGNTSSYGRPSQPSYQQTPSQLPYQQPPPMYSNKGPVAKNEAPSRIIPISALTPYSGRWTIKARVTAKGELRHYNTARGDGKVFSFDLLDSDGGEIRVTCFNAVADQFYNIIEPGRVYVISKGSLKLAQKNYNHLRNDHEIFLEITSTVQPCLEDDTSIPKQQFHFCPISDIECKDNNSVVDVIGIVSSVSPLSSIMRKNGTETQRRTLQLKDMSGRSVEVTLWGGFCSGEGQTLQNMCDAGDFPILALKAGRVSDFSGKSLGTISSSQLLIEPDFPEAHRLKEWFYKEGRSAPVVSISRESSTMGRMEVRKTISQIKNERLGTSEKPDWITVSGTICFIKLDNFCYTACPINIGDRPCSKKVTNNGDGKWRCERCDQSVDECDYRYILQFQIQDHTGLTYVTAFQECAEELLGISAKELFHLKNEEHDDEKCADIVSKVLLERFLFKLKVKEETYSDESRVKSTVIKADKLNFTSEFKHLVDSMSKLKAGDISPPGVKAGNIGFSTGINNTDFVSTGIKQADNMSFSTGMSNTNTLSGSIGVKRPPPPDTDYMSNSGNYGRGFGTPTKPRTQYGNQYTGSAGSGAGFVSCSSCGSTSHNSANCPTIMSAPPTQSYDAGYLTRGSTGGNVSGECYKCQKQGHWARDCPGLSNVPPAYGNRGGLSSGRY